MATKSQLQAALDAQRTKLRRQQEALEATQGMIELLEEQMTIVPTRLRDGGPQETAGPGKKR